MARAPRPLAVIASLGAGQVLVWGSSYYLPAVLARPIAAATGWPAPWITGSLSIGLLVSGLLSPAAGRLIERYGGRPVLAGSAVLLATGLAILAAAPSLQVFVAGWVVLGSGEIAGDPWPASIRREQGSSRERGVAELQPCIGISSKRIGGGQEGYDLHLSIAADPRNRCTLDHHLAAESERDQNGDDCSRDGLRAGDRLGQGNPSRRQD